MKKNFNLGSASRDKISSEDEIFNFSHVIAIEMKFQLGCVIIISSPDEIFHIINPLIKKYSII